MKYKFKANFSSIIKNSESLVISRASKDKLKALAPTIDFENTAGLVSVAFDGCVVNKFNANGHGISTATAIEMKDYFINHPTNVEHYKYDIVGHIVSASFRDITTGDLLSDEDVKDRTDPFYISFGGILYEHVYEYFVDSIKNADFYKKEYGEKEWSASWEVGFNEFVIARGSNLLAKCDIIDDKDEIERLEGNLLSRGGDGFDEEGAPIFQLISGKAYPLGMAFTKNPAASVEGVVVSEASCDNKEEREKILAEFARQGLSIEEIQNKVDDALILMNLSSMSITDSVSAITAAIINKKTEEKKSQQDDLNVITLEKEKTTMDIKEIKDVVKASVEGAIAEQLTSALNKADEKFKQEKSELESEKAIAEKKVTDLEASVNDLKQKVDKLEKEKADIEEAKANIEAKSLFNERFGELSKIYDFSDEAKARIVKKVNSIGTSKEAWEDFLAEAKVLYSAFEKKEETEKQEGEIETAQASKATAGNVQTETSEKLSDALKDAIAISN